jgi:hypothetical protein
MLKEGFSGICPGLFPQYLTSAIFDGLFQPARPPVVIPISSIDYRIVE